MNFIVVYIGVGFGSNDLWPSFAYELGFVGFSVTGCSGRSGRIGGSCVKVFWLKIFLSM